MNTHVPQKQCKYCHSYIPANSKFCPFCAKKQKKGVGKYILIGGVVLVGAALFAPTDDSTKTEVSSTSAKTEEPKVTEAPEEVIEYTSITADQLKDDLKNNALKASETYNDAYLEVTGRLSVIDSSGKYISLSPQNDRFALSCIQCYIKNDDQKSSVANMNVDDVVTIKVKCTRVGEVLGYSADIIEIP